MLDRLARSETRSTPTHNSTNSVDGRLSSKAGFIPQFCTSILFFGLAAPRGFTKFSSYPEPCFVLQRVFIFKLGTIKALGLQVEAGGQKQAIPMTSDDTKLERKEYGPLLEVSIMITHIVSKDRTLVVAVNAGGFYFLRNSEENFRNGSETRCCFHLSLSSHLRYNYRLPSRTSIPRRVTAIGRSIFLVERLFHDHLLFKHFRRRFARNNLAQRFVDLFCHLQ